MSFEGNESKQSNRAKNSTQNKEMHPLSSQKVLKNFLAEVVTYLVAKNRQVKQALGKING